MLVLQRGFLGIVFEDVLHRCFIDIEATLRQKVLGHT